MRFKTHDSKNIIAITKAKALMNFMSISLSGINLHRLVLLRRDDKEHLLVLSANGETLVEGNIQAPAETVVSAPSEETQEKEQKHA